jgi:hypothetical protein
VDFTYILAGLLLLLLIGLFVYARLMSKRQASRDAPPQLAGTPTPGLARQKSLPIAGSEDLVDVRGFFTTTDADFILTRFNDLVLIAEFSPILASVEVTPQGLNRAFADAIRAMPENTSLQIVQIPVVSDAAALTDRLALQANNWSQDLDKRGGLDDAANAWLANRHNVIYATAQTILDIGAASPMRRSFLVMNRNVGAVANAATMKAAADRLFVSTISVIRLFSERGLPLTLLRRGQATEVLYYAYNPDYSYTLGRSVAEARFVDLSTKGETTVADPIQAAAAEIANADSANDISLALAPLSMEIQDDHIEFGSERICLIPYYITGSHFGRADLTDLLGQEHQWASRVIVSYYVTAPSREQISQQARKASATRQGVEGAFARLGRAPSYNATKQVGQIEQARYGAETGEDVPRYFGIYVGLIVPKDRLAADRASFEASMRGAGLMAVPARWVAADVWRSMVPLGTRRHRFSEPAFQHEMIAGLSPIHGRTLYDPDGDFLGLTDTGGGHYAPVSILRRRGTNLPPGDVIVGEPGKGKSFFLKFLVSQWASFRQRVIIIDPKGEFGALARMLGGEVRGFAPGRGFNLLSFPDLPASMQSGDLLALSELIFNGNLALLQSLYAGLRGQLSDISEQKTYLTRALQKAMANTGMDPWDASTWKGKTLTIADVYSVLARELLPEAPEAIRPMLTLLNPYCEKDGIYYHLFNSSDRPVSFEELPDLTCITFGALSLGDETNRILTQAFALQVAYQVAVRSFLVDMRGRAGQRPIHIVVDEASQVLTTGELVSQVVHMMSKLPAFGISLHLAFQDFAALRTADSLITRGGAINSANTLTGVIPMFFLFGQTSQSAQTAASMLQLEPAHARYIQEQGYGRCLAVIPGRGLIPISVKVHDDLAEHFKTQAEDMAGITRAQLEGAA